MQTWNNEKKELCALSFLSSFFFFSFFSSILFLKEPASSNLQATTSLYVLSSLKIIQIISQTYHYASFII